MLVVYTLVCDKVQVISIDVSTEDPPTCYSSYLVCEKLQERVDLFQTVDELRECIKYIRNEDFFFSCESCKATQAEWKNKNMEL